MASHKHQESIPLNYRKADPWGSSERTVDILFVIDNSGSMWEKQALLQKQLWALFDELRAAYSGMPDLHIGVTSTDLGTTPYPITYCETPGGDRGNLLMGACHHSVSPPMGALFIRDVAPRRCEILKDHDGRCLEHDCQLSNCHSTMDATLIEDPLTGCPRCRNFLGQEPEEVLGCMTSLGTTGCGFEQPLEAMLKALDNSITVNGNLLRET